MKLPIYMDNHATTPLDPRVLKKMMPYLTEDFGNAASRQHVFGWKALAGVDVARSQVAQTLGAVPEEIIFTSGATESNNLAILGIAEAAESKAHIITTAIEHKAILDPCHHLEERGWEVTFIPVDAMGLVDPGQIEKSLRPETLLISVMAANNEIGTLQPLKEIGRIARSRNILFHSDAAQAVGRIDLNVEELGLDLVSLSAHKSYGPKGAGALYVRKRNPRIRLMPRFFGGGHEGGLRSGTLNVPAIVGMGEAFAIARALGDEENSRLRALRDRLFQGLQKNIPGLKLNGHATKRLSNNLNLTFPGVTADRLMLDMKDVAVSSASACTTAAPKPSHVLQALGLDPAAAKSTLRFGLGRFNTEEEVDYVIERVAKLIASYDRI